MFCARIFSLNDTRLVKSSGRVTERTLLGYKSLLNLYLQPFFGGMTFSQLNNNTFNRFIGWAKKQCYKGKPLGNETLNKCFTVLKMVCKSSAIEYDWRSGFDPFFGFKKLPEGDPYEQIMPFTVDDISRLISSLTDHWKPYFQFAFSSGLRLGEQIGLKPGDIDWENKTLHIRRAITYDESGNLIEGNTKNKYSRRSIKLSSVMFQALLAQKEINNRLKAKFFSVIPRVKWLTGVV